MAALCRHLFALPVHHVGRAMARSTTRDSSGHVTWRSVSCLPFCSSSPLLATIGVPAMFGAAAAAAAAHRSPAQQAAALMGGPGSGSGRGRGSGDGGGDGASKPPKITLASLAAVVEAQQGEIAALRARVAILDGGEGGGAAGEAGGAGKTGKAAAGGGGQGEKAAPRRRGPAKKAKAGGSVRTSIRPTSNRRTVSAR